MSNIFLAPFKERTVMRGDKGFAYNKRTVMRGDRWGVQYFPRSFFKKKVGESFFCPENEFQPLSNILDFLLLLYSHRVKTHFVVKKSLFLLNREGSVLSN